MSTPESSPYASARRVLIRDNPFHPEAAGILGDVVAFRAGAGFMGTDVVVVRYTVPSDGSTHTKPFGTANLELGDRGNLLARAARLEEEAAKLREMAGEVGR